MLVLFSHFHSSNIVLSLFFHTSPSALPFYTPGLVFFVFFFFLATLGLSCSLGDLCCFMWDISQILMILISRSLVVAHGLSCSTACGILVP